MLLRVTGMALLLLLQGNALAGGLAQTCHLLEQPQLSLLTKDDPKDGGSDRDGGVGGTGIMAEVTGTSPLRLAGCVVEVSDKTAILDETKPVDVSHLASGQVVYAVVRPYQGRLLASSIVVGHSLEGEVSRASDSHLEMLGKQVKLISGVTQMPAQRPATLAGARVKVCGFRLPDGSVQATRVDVYDRLELAGVTGRLQREGNRYLVGGIEVVGVPDNSEWIGEVVSTLGNWSGDRIHVTDFEAAGWAKRDTAPRWVYMQGRLLLDKTGLVDGPLFGGGEKGLIQSMQLRNGDAVTVFGEMSSDGRLHVRQVWSN